MNRTLVLMSTGVPAGTHQNFKNLGYRVPRKFQILGTDGYWVPAKFSTMPTPVLALNLSYLLQEP